MEKLNVIIALLVILILFFVLWAAKINNKLEDKFNLSFKDSNVTLIRGGSVNPNNITPSAVASDGVRELNDLKDVENLALPAGRGKLFFIYANWCRHCTDAKPLIEKLSKMITNVDFFKMDVGSNQKFQDFRESVKKIFPYEFYPTIYFIDTRGNKFKFSEARTEDNLVKFIAMMSAVAKC
jgi:thiol-disulfide isomerase/thioredoxin